MKTLDSTTALRHAGLCAGFLWQDEEEKGGDPTSVDYAEIIGTLPQEVNGAPVYIIHVNGTANSGFGYSYPVECDVKVYLRDGETEEDRVPVVAEATEEEVAQAEQHVRDLACQEYAELSHIVAVGAYTEGEHGEYWYPHEENGIDVSARLVELESAALEQGMHFAPVKEGDKITGYTLGAATQEEIDAYVQAKEEAEAADEEAEMERWAEQQQVERLAFLEKRVLELADEIALHHLVEQHQPVLQPVILETEPQPVPPNGWKPPRPDKFLSEHTRMLIDTYPGMLFVAGFHLWKVGLTLDKQKIVFVPDALYASYEQECLQAVGWTPEHEDEWQEEISVEDEETGEVESPDWPDPLRRKGVWKARQVAHWVGDTEAPEVDYSVWANGTWG
jgi:hypothetical protein